MLLAIDIGNTNIVWGVYSQGQWSEQWRMLSSLDRPANSYSVALQSLLLESNLKTSDFEGIILSSVVPSLIPTIEEACKALFGKEVLILNATIYDDLPIGILNPKEIGTDLVANALGAYQLFREACIVVDFGTALTFTTIDRQGKIVGVAIAPGLKTAMFALYKNTAQLPEVPLELPDSALGKDTVHALQAGVLMGYIGLVESLLNRIETELGVPCKKVATGGLSSIIEPLQKHFDWIDINLTLEGLRWVWELVQAKKSHK